MSQDHIPSMHAVLQSEQAKVLQESSQTVKLFENMTDKESLEVAANEEENIPVLDKPLAGGIQGLVTAFDNDSGQVFYSGKNEDNVDLTTELSQEGLEMQAMELDVILMDHCYTTFPVDMLKNIQNKQILNETLSEKLNSPVKNEPHHKKNLTSLRRSQRQLDKIQREQVEKIKAESAELHRREKEEIEKRKAQHGNDQQEEDVFLNKKCSIVNEEPQNSNNCNQMPSEKISENTSASNKEKSARKSIQQKKSHFNIDEDDKVKDTKDSKEISFDLLEIEHVDEVPEHEKTPIYDETSAQEDMSGQEETLVDIETCTKSSHKKKSFQKKKKHNSSDSNKVESKSKNESKSTKKSKKKLRKKHTSERYCKNSSDAENKEIIKSNEDGQSESNETDINSQVKSDSKVTKKKVKRVHSRRESSISLPDEPALFSQPDVMVKRKSSTEENSVKKDVGADNVDNDKINYAVIPKYEEIEHVNNDKIVSNTESDQTEVKHGETHKEQYFEKQSSIENCEDEIERNLMAILDCVSDNEDDVWTADKISSSVITETDKHNKETNNTIIKEINDPVIKETDCPIIKEMNKSIIKEVSKSVIKEKNKPISKEVSKPFIKDSNKSVIKETNKPPVKELNRSVNKEMNRSVIKEINRPVIKDVNRPINKEMNKPVIKEINKAVIKETNKPFSKESNKYYVKKSNKPIKEMDKHIVKGINRSFVKDILKEDITNNKSEAIGKESKSNIVNENLKLKTTELMEISQNKELNEIIQIVNSTNQQIMSSNDEKTELELEQEEDDDKSNYQKQRKSVDFQADVNEKKHFTRYSMGKIKGNKYVKLLAGKGDILDMENTESDEDPEQLWCICRQPYDERFMIQCDHCEDWFHGNCVGVTQQQGRQLEKSKKEWWCPRCKEEKVDNIKQIASIEDKVKVIQKAAKEAKMQNKLDLKIPNATISAISSIPSPLHSPVKLTSVLKKTIKESPQIEGTKSSSIAEHSGSKNLKVTTIPTKREEEQKLEPVRLNVRNTLKGILSSRCNDANDIKVSENELRKIADHIEEELYKMFKDTGSKYKSKYRSLMFNIKDPRNQGLYRKIVKGIIMADHLVKMTPEELASNELAKWRERESKHMLEMIKREQIEQQQAAFTHVIKKTHKGEVEVDEDIKIPEQKSLKQMPDEIPPLILDTTDKHRSHLFDLNCKICTGKMAPPTEDATLKKVRIAHAISKELATPTDDIMSPEFDSKKDSRKLDDDDSVDQEVISALRSPDSSTYFTSLNSHHSSVWKGFIAMQDVAKFVTTAYKVSGVTDSLEQYIPDSIQVCGRIVPDQVWDYLSKIKQSANKEIIIIRFQPANDEERIPYGKFYSYLGSRKRYGVVGNCSRMIKDFYIIPLASHTPVPTVLMPFKGPGLDSSRPNLLLGVIVRHVTGKQRNATATQSEVASNISSKGSERSYTPPLESMPPSGIEENASQEASKIITTPSAPEEYEPSYTPPLEKMPKLENEDNTSQNKEWKSIDDDKPYDPEDDDNFVLDGTKLKLSKDPANNKNSNESLEQQTRLLLELTKKVEEQKQEIEKSLKLTTHNVTAADQPNNDDISMPSKKCKLDSETETTDSKLDENTQSTFQIPGLGDDWQLPPDPDLSDNMSLNENPNHLELPQKLHAILYKVKQNLQKPDDIDMKDFDHRLSNQIESDHIRRDFITKDFSDHSSKISTSNKESLMQNEDSRAKMNNNSKSTNASKGSLSSMSVSELLEKAQKQLEEMESVETLQNAHTGQNIQTMSSMHQNYWTSTPVPMIAQESVGMPAVVSLPPDLPTYSSNSFSHNMSVPYIHTSHQVQTSHPVRTSHQVPTEHHTDHYVPSADHRAESYSRSEHHSEHYDDRHNRRYYSREYRDTWNRTDGESSERWHRYRRKHWQPSPSYHHRHKNNWYRQRDWEEH